MSSRTEGGLAGDDDELLRTSMRSAARGDGANPKTFGACLRTALDTEPWLRLTDKHGNVFGTFRSFMEAPLNDGGLDMNEVQLKHAAALAGVEKVAQRLLYGEVQEMREHGGDRRSGEVQVEQLYLKNNRTGDGIVARLKRDDPAMAQRVISGELKPNEAARLKGWRKPSILISNPKQVARALQHHMTPDDLAEVARLIQEG
jgi:hypothetical protein